MKKNIVYSLLTMLFLSFLGSTSVKAMKENTVTVFANPENTEKVKTMFANDFNTGTILTMKRLSSISTRDNTISFFIPEKIKTLYLGNIPKQEIIREIKDSFQKFLPNADGPRFLTEQEAIKLENEIKSKKKEEPRRMITPISQWKIQQQPKRFSEKEAKTITQYKREIKNLNEIIARIKKSFPGIETDINRIINDVRGREKSRRYQVEEEEEEGEEDEDLQRAIMLSKQEYKRKHKPYVTPPVFKKHTRQKTKTPINILIINKPPEGFTSKLEEELEKLGVSSKITTKNDDEINFNTYCNKTLKERPYDICLYMSIGTLTPMPGDQIIDQTMFNLANFSTTNSVIHIHWVGKTRLDTFLKLNLNKKIRNGKYADTFPTGIFLSPSQFKSQYKQRICEKVKAPQILDDFWFPYSKYTLDQSTEKEKDHVQREMNDLALLIKKVSDYLNK